jgi:CHAT domain-containing protein/Flp pilus assembly protein TadD
VAKIIERDRLMKDLPDLEKAGKLAEAVAAAETAAALQREIAGEKNRTLMTLYVTVGRLGLARDDWAGARAAYRKAGDIGTALFGVDDWEVTDTRLALADVDRYEKMSPDDRAAVRLAAAIHRDALRLFGQGKFAEARPLFVKNLAILKRVLGDDHPKYASTLGGLAATYFRTGDYKTAEPVYQEVLAIEKRALGERHPVYAETLNSLGTLYLSAGQYGKAEPVYREALAIRTRALGPGHPGTAAIMHNLANLYAATGEYRKAEPLFRDALAIRKQSFGENHPDYAATLASTALLFSKKGEYGKAEPLLIRALTIRKQVLGVDHPDYATSLNNLAVMYGEMDQHAKAEPLYREALAIKKRVLGENHPEYAACLDNLAIWYADTAEYAKAEQLFLEVLAIRKRALGEDHPDYAWSLYHLAIVYRDTEEYGKAEAHFQEALKVWKRVLGENHPAYATGLNGLGLMYTQTNQYEKAIPPYRQSLEIRKRVLGENHPDYALSLENVGMLYTRAGEPGKAEPLLRAAQAIRRRVYGETHMSYAVSLNNLAGVYIRMGDYTRAEQLSREALTIHQALLDSTASAQVEEGQLAFAGSVRYILSNFLNATALAPGRPAADAYAPALRWKGQVFVRQRRQRELLRAAADPATAELADKLLDTTRRLTALSRKTPKPEEADAWKAEVTALTADRDTLERGLVEKSARFRRENELEALTPDQLRKLPPPGTALADFFTYYRFVSAPKPGAGGKWEERLAVFVVRPDREIVRVELGPFDPIRDAIEEWRKDTKRRRPVRGDDDPAAVLRDKLWLPVARHLDGATTVLVSPDADLAKLPFGALPGSKDGAYLIEELAIAVLPVPQLLPDLFAPRRAGEPSLLAVGDVDYGADPGKPTAGAVARAGLRGNRGSGWEKLPATGAEVDAVRASFAAAFPGRPATVLRAAEPTEDAVRRELGKYRCVHLATHGFFAPPAARPAAPDDPAAGPSRAAGQDPGLASGVVLAGANRPVDPLAGADDGILTASEVATLDLAGVDLVVLSACETGLGKLDRTDGVLGLQRAFQVAGARTVVVSLWAVPDEATRALMTRAYASWWDGKKTKLEALVAAQRWVIGNGADVTGRSGPTPPLYWAAFVLAGDWR